MTTPDPKLRLDLVRGAARRYEESEDTPLQTMTHFVNECLSEADHEPLRSGELDALFLSGTTRVGSAA